MIQILNNITSIIFECVIIINNNSSDKNISDK